MLIMHTEQTKNIDVNLITDTNKFNDFEINEHWL